MPWREAQGVLFNQQEGSREEEEGRRVQEGRREEEVWRRVRLLPSQPDREEYLQVLLGRRGGRGHISRYSPPSHPPSTSPSSCTGPPTSSPPS